MNKNEADCYVKEVASWENVIQEIVDIGLDPDYLGDPLLNGILIEPTANGYTVHVHLDHKEEND